MASFNQILNVNRSGMLTRMMNLDVVSNNLANVNTNGYKHSRANFQELLEQKVLNGTRISSTQNMMEQGSLQTTGNEMDLAVQGEGFFSILLPDGRTAYTRDGEFYLDPNRQIVDANGYKLDWEGELPEGVEAVHVNPDGSVMAQIDGAWSQAGQIQLSKFANSLGLSGYGQNLWLATSVSGEALPEIPNTNGYGKIYGGALERSNVNSGEEMVQMINLQRSFQFNLRTYQQTDQMLTQAIQMRRG